jgi:hypothetical protein
MIREAAVEKTEIRGNLKSTMSGFLFATPIIPSPADDVMTPCRPKDREDRYQFAFKAISGDDL